VYLVLLITLSMKHTNFTTLGILGSPTGLGDENVGVGYQVPTSHKPILT